MIYRSIQSILKKHLENNAAVALLGPRQIGKTTLAKEIKKEHEAIYLDLEMPSSLTKLTDPEFFFRFNNDKLIILDEIQLMPDIFKILRGIIDENRERGKKNNQFLLLGSASMHLLKQSAESLAGRISYLKMSGINVLEIENIEENFLPLWVRGGFPESYLAIKDDIAINWLRNFIKTYLERDIPQLGFKTTPTILMRLLKMLAHCQGETINYSTLANNLETQRPNIKSNINMFCELLLLRCIEPWHSNIKKRLVKSPRYYIRDSGILHYLLNIKNHEELLGNPIIGKSWEGFVIENIHSILPPDTETYFYRTASGSEIDLVIKFSPKNIWAVEIKHGISPKLSKHFHEACNDIKATEKYVIYSGKEEFPIGNNIKIISLIKFMKKIKDLY